MKYILFVRATQDSEAGKLPSKEMMEAMGKFNQEMIDAGVFVDAGGFRASSLGARVNFDGDKRTVTDGPFAETKELVSGFWIIDVKSKEEAVDWARRSPNPYGPDGVGHVEIRKFFEREDFAEVLG